MSYPQQQPGAAGAGSAIAVTAKFFPLAFLLFFFKPKVLIDGHELARSGWGRRVISVPPGQHHVGAYTPYLLPSRMGPADTVVTVEPGQLLELEYRAPVFVFARGALGAPPQKYHGLAVLIAVYVPVVLLLLCACLLPGLRVFR